MIKDSKEIETRNQTIQAKLAMRFFMRKMFVLALLFMMSTSAFAGNIPVDSCKSHAEALGNAILEVKSNEFGRADDGKPLGSGIFPHRTTSKNGTYLMMGTIFHTEYKVKATLNDDCSVKSVRFAEWSEPLE